MAEAEIERLSQTGMIALRGDMEQSGAGDLLMTLGLALPEVRQYVTTDAGCVLWLSPDEVLIQCPLEATGDLVDRVRQTLAEAQFHGLVADVSDMRARFAISGPGARATLAKLCPVDLAPGRFEPGEVRRTRLAQVACAFWMTEEDRFELVCFRSVAEYVGAALDHAAGSFKGLSL